MKVFQVLNLALLGAGPAEVSARFLMRPTNGNEEVAYRWTEEAERVFATDKSILEFFFCNADKVRQEWGLIDEHGCNVTVTKGSKIPLKATKLDFFEKFLRRENLFEEDAADTAAVGGDRLVAGQKTAEEGEPAAEQKATEETELAAEPEAPAAADTKLATEREAELEKGKCIRAEIEKWTRKVEEYKTGKVAKYTDGEKVQVVGKPWRLATVTDINDEGYTVTYDKTKNTDDDEVMSISFTDACTKLSPTYTVYAAYRYKVSYSLGMTRRFYGRVKLLLGVNDVIAWNVSPTMSGDFPENQEDFGWSGPERGGSCRKCHGILVDNGARRLVEHGHVEEEIRERLRSKLSIFGEQSRMQTRCELEPLIENLALDVLRSEQSTEAVRKAHGLRAKSSESGEFKMGGFALTCFHGGPHAELDGAPAGFKLRWETK